MILFLRLTFFLSIFFLSSSFSRSIVFASVDIDQPKILSGSQISTLSGDLLHAENHDNTTIISGDPLKGEEDKKDSHNLEEQEYDKEKVQKEINAYILEAYKIQGNKILRDIDTSLQKINSDTETRILAYARIQKTLELRKKRIQNMDLSDNNKLILGKYLDYLITILKRRQAELQE